jgi:hypothetical protein
MLQGACAGLQQRQRRQVSEGSQDNQVYTGFFGQADQAQLVLTDGRLQHGQGVKAMGMGGDLLRFGARGILPSLRQELPYPSARQAWRQGYRCLSQQRRSCGAIEL